MSTVPPLFGKLLKRYREAAGLTQEALAEQARLSARGISDLERGVNRTPRPITVGLLSQALQLRAPERARFEAAAGHAGPAAGSPPAGGQPRQDGTRPALVGRVEELALLERHLAGEGPPILLLAGEPGIGKSRLLHEAAAQAPGAGRTVLQGGCQRRSGQEPYAPILQALEQHVRGQAPAHVRASLRGCAWLVRMLPELAAEPIEPLPSWTLSPEQERRLLVHAVGQYLANVAGPAGTVLLLDDLQWAGPDALDLLAAVVRATPGTHLRVVGAYRDTEVRARDGGTHPLGMLLADLAQADLAAHRTLGPLTTRDALDLLDALLHDTEAEAALRGQIVRRTGGVPYFLISCTRELRAGVHGGPDQASIPWNVGQSVRQRLAVLPDLARELVAAAAVAGRVSPRALLAAVVRQPAAAVARGLEDACGAQLLQEAGMDTYQFAHDIIREVVEADIGAAGRTVLHRRVAAALEQAAGPPQTAALAYHFARGGVRDKALLYLERAADQAAAGAAYAAATGYYRDLISRLDGLGRTRDAARVQGTFGALLFTAAAYPEALAVLEQAAGAHEAAGELEALGHVLGRIGYVHGERGTVEEGIARLQPHAARLEAHGATHGLAALHTALTQLFIHGGQYDAARAAGERAGALARATGDQRLQAAAEREYGSALALLGHVEEARSVLQAAARLAEAAGDVARLIGALNDLAACSAEGEGARAYADRALALAEQLGSPASLAFQLSLRASFDVCIGAWPQARARYEQALALRPQIGDSWGLAYVLGSRGWLHFLEGEWAAATRDLEEATTIAGRSNDLQGLRAFQSVLAERDLLEGRPAAARLRLVPLLDRPGLEELGVGWMLPYLAWACLDLGDSATAEEYAAQAVRRTRPGPKYCYVAALRVSAMVAVQAGAWDAAERRLEEALALARAEPLPSMEASLLLVRGLLYTRTGQPGTGREQVDTALAIFKRLGARKDVERTEQRLLDIR